MFILSFYRNGMLYAVGLKYRLVRGGSGCFSIIINYLLASNMTISLNAPVKYKRSLDRPLGFKFN